MHSTATVGTTYDTVYARPRRLGVHQMLFRRALVPRRSRPGFGIGWEFVPEYSGSGPNVNTYATPSASNNAPSATRSLEGRMTIGPGTPDSILGQLNHRMPISDHDSRSITGAWVSLADELSTHDETEFDLSWISFTSTKAGIPLNGPATLADLPRAEPRVWFDFLPEDD